MYFLIKMDALMTFWIFLIGIIFGIVISTAFVYRVAITPLHNKIEKLSSDKRSLSTIYGQITEQFAPFMNGYPYLPDRFRFIGSPIDGIQFEEDKIIFVEFKSHKSKLTKLQSHIKDLINKGKIEWFEFRIS